MGSKPAIIANQCSRWSLADIDMSLDLNSELGWSALWSQESRTLRRRPLRCKKVAIQSRFYDSIRVEPGSLATSPRGPHFSTTAAEAEDFLEASVDMGDSSMGRRIRGEHGGLLLLLRASPVVPGNLGVKYA